MPIRLFFIALLLALAVPSVSMSEPRIASPNEPMMLYVQALQGAFRNQWKPPAGDYNCSVNVKQDRSGYIKSVVITDCPSGRVSNSILIAISEASPLPRPDDPELYREEFILSVLPPK